MPTDGRLPTCPPPSHRYELLHLLVPCARRLVNQQIGRDLRFHELRRSGPTSSAPTVVSPSSCGERAARHCRRRGAVTDMRLTIETEPAGPVGTTSGKPTVRPRPAPPRGPEARQGPDWHHIWYHGGVDAAVLLQEARRRSGLSRRQLARRGGTSPSTLSAYESGTSVPSVSTLSRLLRAAGFEVEASLRPIPTADEQQLAEKIEALFSFVDVLPRGHRGPLKYPVFGAVKPAAR